MSLRAIVKAVSRARPSARAVVYGGSTLWATGFAIASTVRYETFGDQRYDLGNFTQAIWSTAHGHLLEVTEVGGHQVSRMGIHVDPIIALFAPMWWLWPSPALLLVAQAVALASGALPVFWLARKHLPRERDASFVALSYLLCPAIGWNAMFEFHAVSLAVPLLLLTIWFLDESRFGPFIVTATAAMLCQEQIGLIVGFLGVWYGLARRRWAAGLSIAVLGFAVTAVDFLVVLRHFSGGSPFTGRYAAVGGSFGGIAKTAIEHPLRLLDAVQVSDLVGAIGLVLPVLGLCLLSSLSLAALPQAVLVTLSGNQSDWRFIGQNVLVMVPFVYAGAALELARRSHRRGKRMRLRARHVFVFSAGLAVWIGPSPLSVSKPASSHLDSERHAVRLIPPDARVSATNHLGSHLASRRYIYVFPVTKTADWVAVDSADIYLPPAGFASSRSGITVGAHDLYPQRTRLASLIHALRRDPRWAQVYAHSTVYVFERRRRVKTA